ncbi:MAG: hypothetical protein AAFP89_26275 [Bacteroidota bacterium]
MIKHYLLSLLVLSVFTFSCNTLPNPDQDPVDPTALELNFLVVNGEDEPLEQVLAYISIRETAEEMAENVQTQGLGYPGVLLRTTSAQGRLDFYPLIDFPNLKDDTEVHFYIRTQSNGGPNEPFVSNLTSTNSFLIKKVKPRGYDIKIVLE